MSRRKIALISGISVAGVLIALLAGYLLYFGLGHRALPGMKVGEVDVSGKTAAQIAADLEKAVESQQINFKGAQLNGKSAKLDELGISVSAEKAAAAAIAPNSQFSSYFTLPFTGKTVNPKLNIDEAKLSAYSTELASTISDAKPAVEPKIIAAETGFSIQPGESGAGIDPQIFFAAATDLAATQKSVDAQITLSEIKPKLSVTDLENTKAEAEKLLATEASIVAGDETITADTKEKIAWISINEDKASVNEAAIKSWLTNVAEPLNQEAIQGKRNISSSGKVLEIVKAAQVEKKVTNFDDVFNTVKSSFAKQQTANAKFEIAVGAEAWEDRIVAKGAEHLPYKATEGEKWIDVNLSTFKMTAYEGATPVRGPITVVTGEPNSPTVVGKFAIWYKTASQDMRGTHSDGSEYHIKDVPSNMFFHGDYAIHGAPWWGPDEWGFQGSNGCVNTPPAEAKWLFNWAPIGTVVVTHY